MATAPKIDELDQENFHSVTYQVLSREEGRALFEQRSQEWLGMSGEELIRRWESGGIDDPDRTDVIMLAIMIPLAR